MNISNEKVFDTNQRPLRDLRISVTDKCNFRCNYCMPVEIFGPDYQFLPSNRLLTFEEINRIAHLFSKLGVEKLRITGGEPLMRGNIEQLIQMLSNIEGIKEIAMTTNGYLLAKYATSLKEAGLHRVSISLDSLDNKRFGKINGRGVSVQNVLDGVESALNVGLKVKINMVVQKGINDVDILPMARFFKEKGITLRFIEFMDVGNTNGWKLEKVVPSKEIIRLINEEMPLESLDSNYYGEVATRYKYKESETEVGFISSVTQAFCQRAQELDFQLRGICIHVYSQLQEKIYELLYEMVIVMKNY